MTFLKFAVVGLMLAIVFIPLLVAVFAVRIDPGNVVTWTLAATLVAFVLCISYTIAFARDDGRYAQSPLKPWFDSLKSGKGPCCSDADGTAVSDADWEVDDGHFRVRIEDQWWPVPDDAVLTQPNLYGRTMVWPNIARGLNNSILKMDIRCFMPGSMT